MREIDLTVEMLHQVQNMLSTWQDKIKIMSI